MLKKIIKIFKDLEIEQRNDSGIGYPELILAESSSSVIVEVSYFLIIYQFLIPGTLPFPFIGLLVVQSIITYAL